MNTTTKTGKLISSIIMSLDGFAAPLNGDISKFKVEQEFFDYAGTLIDAADMALYGRNTFSIMEGYWPNAGNNPNASKHDKEHSAWYNKVNKLVLSTTSKSTTAANTRILSTNIAAEINELKQDGHVIQIFGSPGVVSSLTAENLIDEYHIFISPIFLGNGLPVFRGAQEHLLNLNLISSKAFKSGVMALHYTTN